MGQVKTIEDNQLWDLLEREWQYLMENTPEFATFLGEYKFDDRLTDLSDEALKRKHHHDLEVVKELKSMEYNNLSEDNKLNFDLYLEKVLNEIREYSFKGYLMPINQMDGVQNDFSRIIQMMPFKKEKDFLNYLSRLNAFPVFIDQLIDLMKKGVEGGFVLPKSAVINVPSQIKGQLPEDYKKSPYFQPLESDNKFLFSELRAKIEAAIQDKLYASFNRLNDYMEKEYIPACRDTFGLSDIPDGKGYYEHKLKMMTTTDLTAEQIHEIGKNEVERIFKEMMNLAQKVGFNGSYNEFLEHLKVNPEFYFTDPNMLMMTYRDISKRADKELPALFKVLPRLPYGVDEIPSHQAPSYPTAYYMPADINMTRPGIFYANTSQLEIRPKYEMEALTLHEAVPGHHLQISLSLELEGLPKFRRLAMSDFTGYIEGWGLYSEKLGEVMGFYKDPYSKFGQLSFEMWRACRLVIDTGLHAFNWSREKSIQYLKDHTGKSEPACAVEVDRYMSIPGQATAYKIGELKILELRKKFEEIRGDDFDIREFHDVILRNGALPLNVLEKYVNDHLNEVN